jgi:MFS family permease
MGNGLQSTLLPLRADLEPFSTNDIGILGSAYYIGFVAGALKGAQLIQRVGHIRVFTAMVAIASAAPLLHSLWALPVAWWLIRAAYGFAAAMLFMIIESWLQEKSTNENRGVIFGTYTIINLTVVTIGQLMINLSTPASFVLFILASILVSFAAVPVALTSAAAPAPIASVEVRILRIFRLAPVAIAGAFLVGAQQGAFWSLGPIFADRIGLNTTEVTFFMSTAVVGGALGQWPLGKLSDRLDRRKVLICASLFAAAVGLTIRLVNPDLETGILALTMLWGMAAFPLYSICAAHLNDHVKDGGFVEAASAILIVYAAGAVIGPVLVSLSMTVVTPYALFGGTAAFQLVLVAVAAYGIAKRKAIDPEDRSSFTDALREVQSTLPIPFPGHDPDHDPRHEKDTEAKPA